MMSTLNSSPYVGRFAPSPSGRLHLGSLLTAYASYLRAKSQHGRFLIRIEDLDLPRCPERNTPIMMQELAILGLFSDDKVLYQSHDTELYHSEIARLYFNHQAYKCTCTRSDLKKRPCCCFENNHHDHTLNQPSIDPQSDSKASFELNNQDSCALSSLLTPQLKLPLPTAKERFSIRVNLEKLLENYPSFKDGNLGVICKSDLETELTHTMVLLRADNIIAYNLAVVVDDLRQGVTEIVRGADLLDATFLQLAFYEMLGEKAPDFFHIPLITNKDGNKLSKQNYAPGALDEFTAGEALIKSATILNILSDDISCEILNSIHTAADSPSKEHISTYFKRAFHDCTAITLLSQALNSNNAENDDTAKDVNKLVAGNKASLDDKAVKNDIDRSEALAANFTESLMQLLMSEHQLMQLIGNAIIEVLDLCYTDQSHKKHLDNKLRCLIHDLKDQDVVLTSKNIFNWVLLRLKLESIPNFAKRDYESLGFDEFASLHNEAQHINNEYELLASLDHDNDAAKLSEKDFDYCTIITKLEHDLTPQGGFLSLLEDTDIFSKNESNNENSKITESSTSTACNEMEDSSKSAKLIENTDSSMNTVTLGNSSMHKLFEDYLNITYKTVYARAALMVIDRLNSKQYSKAAELCRSHQKALDEVLQGFSSLITVQNLPKKPIMML